MNISHIVNVPSNIHRKPTELIENLLNLFSIVFNYRDKLLILKIIFVVPISTVNVCIADQHIFLVFIQVRIL